jgi:hypothetical protein
MPTAHVDPGSSDVERHDGIGGQACEPRPDRWSDGALDAWRQVADPVVDPLSASLARAAGLPALARLTRQLDDWEAPLPPDLPDGLRAHFDQPVTFPPWVDHARIRRAEDLFHAFGPITVTIVLLNGYPRFLTSPSGARAMYEARLFSRDAVASRMLELAQFALFMGERGGLSAWTAPDGGERLGRGLQSFRKLRVIHANIRLLLASDRGHRRRWTPETLGAPISQEDLAFAVLCFSVDVIEGLQKAGFDLSAEDQESVLMAWRTAGWLLGLADALQPADMADAVLLRNALRRRHGRGSPEAAVVVKELLHVVEGLLPWGTRSVPAALMRYQLGPDAADQLGVPTPRVLLALIRGTEPLWRATRLFAALSKAVSPRLLAWASSADRLGAARRLALPEALAARLGSDR